MTERERQTIKKFWHEFLLNSCFLFVLLCCLWTYTVFSLWFGDISTPGCVLVSLRSLVSLVSVRFWAFVLVSSFFFFTFALDHRFPLCHVALLFLSQVKHTDYYYLVPIIKNTVRIWDYIQQEWFYFIFLWLYCLFLLYKWDRICFQAHRVAVGE